MISSVSEICINCQAETQRVVKPVCAHTVCAECVYVQGHLLPKLSSKGIYICYECGDRALLPQSYFHAVKGGIDALPALFRKRLELIPVREHSRERVITVHSHEGRSTHHPSPVGSARHIHLAPNAPHTHSESHIVHTSQHLHRFPPGARIVQTIEHPPRVVSTTILPPRQVSERVSVSQERVSVTTITKCRECGLTWSGSVPVCSCSRETTGTVFTKTEEHRRNTSDHTPPKVRKVNTSCQTDETNTSYTSAHYDHTNCHNHQTCKKCQEVEEASAQALHDTLMREKQAQADLMVRLAKEQEQQYLAIQAHREQVASEERERRARLQREEEQLAQERINFAKEREHSMEQDALKRQKMMQMQLQQWEDQKAKEEREREEKRRLEEIEREQRLEKEQKHREILEQQMQQRLSQLQQEERDRLQRLEDLIRERRKEEEERENKRIRDRDARDKEDRDRMEAMRAREERILAEESKRREAEEKDRRQRRDYEESERLQRLKEWQERMDKEKKQRELDEENRREKERLAREKQEAEEKDKRKKELLEFELIMKTEREKLNSVRNDIQKLEKEKADKERLEKERIEEEKEKARLLQEQLKRSKIVKETTNASRKANKKCIPIKIMVQAQENAPDKKYLTISTASDLFGSYRDRNTGAMKNGGKSHAKGKEPRSSRSPSNFEREESMKPEPTNCPLPMPRFPMSKRIDSMAASFGRTSEEKPKKAKKQQQFYIAPPEAEDSIEIQNQSNAVETLEPIDQEEVDKEVEQLRDKIKKEVQRRQERDLKERREAERRQQLAMFAGENRDRVRGLPSSDRNYEDGERVSKPVGGSSTAETHYPLSSKRPELVKSERNMIKLSELQARTAQAARRPSPCRDILTANNIPCVVDDCSELRNNFYRAKSLLRMELDKNPNLFTRSSNTEIGIPTASFQIKTDGSTPGSNTRSYLKEVASKKSVPMLISANYTAKKTLYDAAPTPPRGAGVKLGFGANMQERTTTKITSSQSVHMTSSCQVHTQPCCPKWYTARGKHCCHCFLIKSDVHNSNHKYNSALVTLNTGCVLRSLMKETHCEEEH